MTQESPTFLTAVQGFTPVIDALAQAVGHTTAAVYGVVWRYCQMDERICRASVAQIGRRLGLHPKTTRRHLKKLCELGYLEDTTPDRNNGPHIYRDIGADKIIALTQSRPQRTDPPPELHPHLHPKPHPELHPEPVCEASRTVPAGTRRESASELAEQRTTQHAPRNTHHASRFTLHASRITHRSQKNSASSPPSAVKDHSGAAHAPRKTQHETRSSPHPRGTERPTKREVHDSKKQEKGGAAVAASARHPAIRAFRQNAHRYPAKSWFQDVADTVGEGPADVEFWGQVVKAWVGTGYNPVNVRGMLDYYRRGELPSTGASNAAGPRRRGPPSKLQSTIETGIRILKQEGKWPT
jgi:hypothetical protein